jgi:hypothetical protein
MMRGKNVIVHQPAFDGDLINILYDRLSNDISKSVISNLINARVKYIVVRNDMLNQNDLEEKKVDLQNADKFTFK